MKAPFPPKDGSLGDGVVENRWTHHRIATNTSARGLLIHLHSRSGQLQSPKIDRFRIHAFNRLCQLKCDSASNKIVMFFPTKGLQPIRRSFKMYISFFFSLNLFVVVMKIGRKKALTVNHTRRIVKLIEIDTSWWHIHPLALGHRGPTKKCNQDDEARNVQSSAKGTPHDPSSGGGDGGRSSGSSSFNCCQQ